MRKTWRPVILALLSMMLIEVSVPVSLAATPQLKSSGAEARWPVWVSAPGGER